MKLLFDENLPPRLVQLFSSRYPTSTHVRDVNLAKADDETVWAYARVHGFVIVSKDSDFHQRSFLMGPPPKVIWIRCGNCPTTHIADLLQKHQAFIQTFLEDEEAAFLELG